MSASSLRVVGLVVAALWLAAGCSSSKKVDVGTGCLLNSDCNSPLSCSFGKCHDTCKEARDCPAGESCVKLSSGSVCQLPADVDCQPTGSCDENLVCAADLHCRASCQAAADCSTGQSCVTSVTSATSVCADSTYVDPTGQLQQKGVVGAACVLGSDCDSPLSCIMNKCHYLCQSTNVCPKGESCVKTATGAVCQLPAEAGCDSATPCSGGLLCAVDYRCRAGCRSASDCTAGQSCAGGVCADKSPPTTSDSGVDVQGIDVGTSCLLNSDCNSPLSCTFGKCHDTCLETRDCPTGESCVQWYTGAVCQLPADVDCGSTGICEGGFICAADLRCRASCQTAADCLAAQSCASGVCADSTDVDTNGQLQQKGVVGAACVLGSDCDSPLSCIMNKCHYLCQNTKVCPTGQSCVHTATGAVCQLPAEAACDSATPCSGGLLCAVDYRCRVSCRSASDCTAGQTCAGGVCADKGDLDRSGQLSSKSPPTRPDGGVDAPERVDVPRIDDGGKDTKIVSSPVEAGGPSSSGGAGGTRDSGQPDLAGTGGSSGGSSGTLDSGSGGTTSSGSCTTPGSDAVNFCNGQAQGVMTGHGFIALGVQDTATSPVCADDPRDLSKTRPITTPPVGQCTGAGTCPLTSQTVWDATDKLCITGTISAVTGSPADYTNWGLQIGVNVFDQPATDAGSGTLGKSYTHMTFTATGTVTPTPPNTAIRAVIHLVSQELCTTDTYCATMQASGKPMTLTSFNTACWNGSGTALKASDIPNIDKIGIQISSDISNTYTVTDYCLTGIQFDSN